MRLIEVLNSQKDKIIRTAFRSVMQAHLEHYPESDYTLSTLKWIMDDYKIREDIEGAKQYIEELKGKTENSVIKNALQKYSDELE